MQAAVSPFVSGKIPGRKRGRPPLLRNLIKMDFSHRYHDNLPNGAPIKVPKKRGRKPGFKLSPPSSSSTPEPDMSCIPQDGATVPHTAAPQPLTVCIYINKRADTGPNLDRKKIQLLPDHFGPDRPSVVLQQAVQGCIDSAFQQKNVFTLLTQGYGGEKISATFDGKQHLLSLPVVNSIDYVLRFLKKLCRSLNCDNLFSEESYGESYSEAEASDDGKRSDPGGDPSFSHKPGGDPFSLKPAYGFRSQQFNKSHSSSGGFPSPSGGFSPGGGSDNRTGVGTYSAAPEPQDPQDSQDPQDPRDLPGTRVLSPEPSSWSVEDVVWFLKHKDPQALGTHAELFRKHEIDGNALLLLKSDVMMKYLGLKLGPALKLCFHIDKLRLHKV
ncbi:unnamed protein product [Knipowitschia caucasica]|uniref:SAM domain-containing protein n=1 Tax=Knipowitschia caucasica TaxID=637954 RepID=A0AAV2JJB1_KNICA